eukprot:GFUD01037940.1.p1 GENE.GFUD01037940.1~~GFUD01037940.1.p1  ORF type:complete len:226 (+),score=51.11 GFUD01037940.1:47-724(+)
MQKMKLAILLCIVYVLSATYTNAQGSTFEIECQSNPGMIKQVDSVDNKLDSAVEKLDSVAQNMDSMRGQVDQLQLLLGNQMEDFNDEVDKTATKKQMDELNGKVDKLAQMLERVIANSGVAQNDSVLLLECEWTEWLNRDSPTGTGDYEEFDEHNKLKGFSGCNVQRLEVQVVGKTDAYTTEAEVLAGTGDIVHITKKGMRCIWTSGEQPDGECLNYEVRFCCIL